MKYQSYARLEYKLKAEFVTRNGFLSSVGKIISSDHKSSTCIHIRGNVPPDIMELCKRSARVSGAKNFFFSRSAAPVMMDCELMTCDAPPAGEILVSTKIKNLSTKAVYEIRADLIVCYHLKASGHNFRHTSTIGTFRRRFTPNIETNQVANGIINIRVPHDACTIEGKLIRRFYKVRLTFFRSREP